MFVRFKCREAKARRPIVNIEHANSGWPTNILSQMRNEYAIFAVLIFFHSL